jgi:hypothetical protein
MLRKVNIAKLPVYNSAGAFCPVCRLHITAVTCTHNESSTPKDGDGLICYQCYSVLKFAQGGRVLEEFTQGDYDAMDEQMQRVFREWRSMSMAIIMEDAQQVPKKKIEVC